MTRLAVTAGEEDVRLFAARLVRRYRTSDPRLAEQLKESLQARPGRTRPPLREAYPVQPALEAPDEASPLSFLRTSGPAPMVEPLLPHGVKQLLLQVLAERQQVERLAEAGLQPTRSAIFVGPPGVGKTLSAGWIARQLVLPLHILDLSAVMSSYLGRTGANLRRVLDFARETRCVLLLDEIDAIAKRRSDDLDVGELKRIVAVILQEVDTWPATSLLLATTNHPELVDPALWRRFDLIVDFPLPDAEQLEAAIPYFLGADAERLGPWIRVLALVLRGLSLSDVERDLVRMRRSLALGQGSEGELVTALAQRSTRALDRAERIELATLLACTSDLSQHAVSGITGVSRDTIRKRVGAAASRSRRGRDV